MTLRHVAPRLAAILVLLTLSAAACTGGSSDGSGSAGLSSSAGSTSTSPASTTTVAPVPETSSTVAPVPETSSTTVTAPASTTGATAAREVSNPLWNPYDPDQFGEEFPSITALGEVTPPDTPQDVLAARAFEANGGDAATPLGNGCSPGDAPLADGVWAGGIAAAGVDHVSIDLVCLYPQQDDMFTAPDGGECIGPFESADPCMTNGSDLLRDLPLSPSADIVVARLMGSTDQQVGIADLAATSVEDFLTYVELGTYTPFLIEVDGGVVVRIEQYRSLWLPGL